MKGRVLAIGGSDPSGGAGVQADIKTITALGGYAASAITAITVQDTEAVRSVQPLPAELVAAQARAVLADIGVDAVKTGQLGSAATAEAVAALLESVAAPVVVDPVMASTSGWVLLEPEAFAVLRERILPRAALVTPNAPEASRLSDIEVVTTDDLRRAGERLLTSGVGAVLMKGGHIGGESVIDVLMTRAGETRFESPRVATRHDHGTGCTLASACAVGLAQGLPLVDAVARAHAYVAEALRRAPGYGRGRGPLDHGWPLERP